MVDWNDPQSRAAFRDALDGAIDSWLQKQFAIFGKWSVRGLAAALFSWVCYLYLSTHGFKF